MKTGLSNYIAENNLFTGEDKLLVAVSGGADSVLLLILLHELHYNVSIAHCNFKLRGKDADADEKFVIDLAKQLKIKYYVSRFNTKDYAKSNKLSIEEAARNLRYDRFEKIRHENHYDYILTGHHLNDKIETFFINLTAGTGIKGLRSIKSKSEKIIRPFLFTTHNDIETYCIKNNIKFRTDKTNFENKFLRNKIRNEIIPFFYSLNPNFDQTMSRNLDIFKEFELIYQDYIQYAKTQLVEFSGGRIFIDKTSLLNHKTPLSILYELLSEYGFKPTHIKDINNKLSDTNIGKAFYSTDYKLLIDREKLILEQYKDKETGPFEIPEGTDYIEFPIKLSFNHLKIGETNISNNKNEAYIDSDKIQFPLKARTWEKGDFFYPLGMKGKKKISDYFIDNKINKFDKEKIYLLFSGNDIIWIIGKRLDNRYKITEETKNVLKVEWL